MPTIKFVREKKEVECEEGANLRKVAMENGIQLYQGPAQVFNCHGFGHCGECRVYIKDGMENLGKKTLKEKFRIAASFFKLGHEHEVRLACQTRVNGDVEVYTQPEFNWTGEKLSASAKA